MANTYTQIFYHIVFGTKERRPLIRDERRDDFLRFVWGINKNMNCHLHRVNAVEDHIHILTAIHPTVALADYIKRVKTGTTHWIQTDNVFPHWSGWQDGYAAFTLSVREREPVIEYIKGQQEHHRTESFVEEYKRILVREEIDFDEQYVL